MNELPDENIVREKIRKLGIEWVIVTRPMDIKTVQSYVPCEAYAVPSFYGYWGPY